MKKEKLSKPTSSHNNLLPEVVERRIFLIRGQKVMLDSHLAELYGVPTGRLNEQVKRNIARFPIDFMFQLKRREFENLKSQNAISSSTWGGRRILPYAFTEQGVAMLSSVLKSKRAVHINITIMRAFVRLRKILDSHKDIAKRLEKLELQVDVVMNILDDLVSPKRHPQRKIGFRK